MGSPPEAVAICNYFYEAMPETTPRNCMLGLKKVMYNQPPLLPYHGLKPKRSEAQMIKMSSGLRSCKCRIEKECVKYTSLKKTKCQLAWPHELDSKFVAAGICQRRSGLHSWDLDQQKRRPSSDVNGCVCVCVLRASMCVIACVVFISLTKHTHAPVSKQCLSAVLVAFIAHHWI